MKAEKENFIRPFEPFYCGDNNEHCGYPPIKTPKRSC